MSESEYNPNVYSSRKVTAPEAASDNFDALEKPTTKIDVRQVMSVGSEVTVHRNGKDGAPDYLEAGWTVIESNEDEGTVTVQSANTELIETKKYRATTLAGFQPSDSVDAERKGKYGIAPIPVPALPCTARGSG